MLLKDFFAKKIKCSEGRREEKVCDGVVADKVGTGAPGNEKCFKADQSLECLQRYGVYVKTGPFLSTLYRFFFQASVLTAVLEIHDRPVVFLPGHHHL